MKLGAFLLVLWLLTTQAEAASVYVRAGASGAATGADWNDAFTALPATLNRGDTYYIADGSYAGYTFNDAISGSTAITIKKAITADHGTETGWNSSYGDGQAIFEAVAFTTHNWVFDGQTGGGPGAWTNGLGFKIYHSPYLDGAKLLESGGQMVTNVSVKHTELTYGTSADTGDYASIVYLTSGGDGWTFSRCAMYGVPGDIAQIRALVNFTVEYCYFADNLSVPAKHGDVWESDSGGINHTYRYNWFRNCIGTYAISDQSGAGNPTNVFVYGNVFSWDAGGGFSNGILGSDSSGGPIINGQFHHNTVFGMNSGQLIYANGGSTVTASNNIIYGTVGGGGTFGWTGVTAHDYNAFRYAGAQSEANIQNFSGDPFNNAAAGDFTLTANTDAGVELGTPFNVDMLGETRTTRTRGSFEYGTNAPSPTSTITTLRVGTLILR